MKDNSQTPERLKRGRGQPTKLTMQMIEDFERLLPVCMYLDSIADMLGISRITWRNWIKRGKTEIDRMTKEETDLCAESEELYVEFFYRHKSALAKGEFQDNQNILSAGNAGQWQASAWRLERRFQHKYGAQAREVRILEKKALAMQEKLDQLNAREAEIVELRAEIERLTGGVNPDQILGK